MPVAVRITPDHMSREEYERVIVQLQESGADGPEGRLFHAAYGDDEVHMFEVWESPEHFAPHRDRLFEALQGVGVGAGNVEVDELHSARPD
jgi:quinol monooxygenase YgiN